MNYFYYIINVMSYLIYLSLKYEISNVTEKCTIAQFFREISGQCFLSIVEQ